jgi:hypothetical protein
MRSVRRASGFVLVGKPLKWNMPPTGQARMTTNREGILSAKFTRRDTLPHPDQRIGEGVGVVVERDSLGHDKRDREQTESQR